MPLRLLAGLVAEPRYVDTTDRATAAGPVSVLPEMVDGLPRLDVGVDDRPRIGIVGVRALNGVSDWAADALEAALAGEPPPPPAADDPLIRAIRRVAEETAAGAVQATGPALVAALLAAQGACAEAWTTPRGRLAAALTTLASRGEGGASVVEAAVAALQARLAGALVAVANEAGSVPALAQAVVGNRLALLFPSAGMDPWAELGRVLAVLRSPLPVTLANGIVSAVGSVVAGVIDRKAKGKSTADDQAILLRFLPADLIRRGAAVAGTTVARDPAAVAFLLPGLGRWVDTKTLVSDKVPAPLAAQLLDPAIGIAAAAVWGELISELRRWEVIAALAAAVEAVPARRVTPAESPVRPDASLSGVAPYGAPAIEVEAASVGASLPLPEQGCVVVVGLGLVRSRVATSPVSFEAVEAAWSALARGAHAVDLGVVGVLVYSEPKAALRAALSVAGRFRAAGVRPAIGLGAGSVRRTPGAAGVSGAAVEGAVRWLAHPGPTPRGIRALRVSEGWLCGAGIGVHRSFIEDLEHAEGFVPLAKPGERLGTVELRLAVELDDTVLIFLPIPGLGGGAELVTLTRAEWQALRPAPAARAPVPAAQVPAAVRPSRSPARLDSPSEPSSPGGEWRWGGPVSPAPAADPVEARRPSDRPPLDRPVVERAPPVAVARHDPFVTLSPAVDGADPLAGPSPSARAASTSDPFRSGGSHAGPTPAGPVHADPFRAEPPAPRRSPVSTDPFAPEPSRAGAAPPASSVAWDPFKDAPGVPPPPDPVPPAVDGELLLSGDPPPDANEEDALAELDFGELGDDMPAAPPADALPPTPWPSPAPSPEAPSPWALSPEARSPEAPPLEALSPEAPPLEALSPEAPPLEALSPPVGEVSAVGFSLVGDLLRDDEPTQEEPWRLPAVSGGAPAAGGVNRTNGELEDAAGPDDDWLNAILEDPAYGLPPPAPPAPARGSQGALATPGGGAPAVPPAPPETLEYSLPGPPPGRAAPVSPRATSSGAAVPSRAASSAGAMHLDQLFYGYIVLVLGGEVWFGRPYGARIVDRHVYSGTRNLDEAYRGFLRDKIAEGFVPRTDLTADLPLGSVLQPLDAVRLAAAWRALT